MKVLETLRNKGFWMMDALRGHVIKKNYDDICNIIRGGKDVENLQKQYLMSVLNHAVENVPYYRQFKCFSSLSDFPVIDKKIVKDDEDAFIARGYNKETLFRQETSGSTGMPFVVYQDYKKRQRATADTLVFSQLADYIIGTKLYFSRVWAGVPKPSKVTCIKQNWIVQDSSNLSDDFIEKMLYMWEHDDSTKSVLLFASTLTAIAKFIIKNNFRPNAKITSFITISEALDTWTKRTIQERYNTNVFSRYSNQELGIMAQQLPGGDDFLANTASFYFEILDMDKDIPALPGTEGRIVVTDLFAKAMPLIRYDTGDIAIVKEKYPKQGRMLFESIGGRKVDYIFDTKANMLSPFVINNPMHEFLEIQQYQFIQDSETSYTMLLNMHEGTSFNKEGQMINMLRSILGQDAKITVKYVSEIPVMKSGKRKQIVNNYKLL